VNIRNALADSLVVFAIAASSAKISSLALASAAIDALGESGSDRAKVVFPRAGDALFKIAQEASDIGIRAAAIWRITGLADHVMARRLLRGIAGSDNPAAINAVRALWDGMPDKGGLDVLRDLAIERAVSQPLARRELDRVARKYGWVPNEKPIGGFDPRSGATVAAVGSVSGAGSASR